MVRFETVLASSGSVVPLLKNKLPREGYTLTHKDIVRYFMTITEAVQLVLNSVTMKREEMFFYWIWESQ